MDTNRTTDKITELSKKASIASILMAIAAISVTVLRCVSIAALEKSHEPEYYIGIGNILTSIIQNLIYVAMFMICKSLFDGIVKQGTPFRTETVSRLKLISLLLAVSSAVPSFISYICYMIITPSDLFDLRSSLTNGVLKVNLNYIFAALLFFVLTVIFRYGCQLQQESDETL